jgi:CRP-like cAMP-binding protein
MVAIRKTARKPGKTRSPGPAISPAELMDALPNSKRVSFEAKTTIFREGSASEDCWLIVRGKVEVRKKTAGGNVPLAVVKAGEFLGEMAMVSGARRSASAVAQTNVEAVMILYSDFEALMRTTHPFASRLSLQFSVLLAERCNRLLKLIAKQKKTGDVPGKKTRATADARNVFNRVFTLWAV